MEFREVRKRFMEILGNRCKCGESGEQVLELTKKSSNDSRKINHLLREKGVEETFNVLKEDFLILCLNCKRKHDLSDPFLQKRKEMILKKSRERYYGKTSGRKVKKFVEEPVQEFPEFLPKQKLVEVEVSSNEFTQEELRQIGNNPAKEAMFRRLKYYKKKNLTIED